MYAVRIVRHNGYIVRDQDVVNHLVARGWDALKASAAAARAPTVVGAPLSYVEYDRKVRADERAASIAVMASEPDNGDRFY